MPVFVSRFGRWALAGIGAVSGAVLFYSNSYDRDYLRVYNSWTTNFEPSVKWDHNWDRREAKSLVHPSKIVEKNGMNGHLENKKSKVTRHLILVRHGHYNINGETDKERILTDLGRKQAAATGKRLAELGMPYSLIVRSTMARAQETSRIIEKSLTNVQVQDDSLLTEGAPIPPEPPIGNWKSEKHFYRDGPRIEAAFRKYFHRADPSQEKDSYTILVCHANVIRYFVCRALQFPPEAWLRLGLGHASITWISIQPSGRVSLLCLGDTGHLPPEHVSFQ